MTDEAKVARGRAVLQRAGEELRAMAFELDSVRESLQPAAGETIPEAARRVVRERDEAVRTVEELVAAARKAITAWQVADDDDGYDALEAALVELAVAAGVDT